MVKLIYSKACIHGRFQPFHNDHLSYFLQAFKKYHFLYIGITKPDIGKISETDFLEKKYRDDPSNNIFTYSERCKIIEVALLANGISKDRFSFLKFDIDNIESIDLDKSIVCVSNIVEQWNEHKIEKLKNEGYSVDILYRDILEDKLSSTRIRELIRLRNSEWKNLVPKSTVSIIEKLI